MATTYYFVIGITQYMYIVHAYMYIVHVYMYIVHAYMYIVHVSMYIVHVYIVTCTLYMLTCTLCMYCLYDFCSKSEGHLLKQYLYINTRFVRHEM